MSINERIITALKPIKIPVSVSEHPINDANGATIRPDTFAVIIPLYDGLTAHADDRPTCCTEEVELALYVKGNYLALRNKITRLLLDADIVISGRRYIELEKDTGYHHYIFELVTAHEYEEE